MAQLTQWLAAAARCLAACDIAAVSFAGRTRYAHEQ
jgi:hypothetical protein